MLIFIENNKESQVSVLMRIMTNYLQVMTATLSYGMKFPDALLNIFIPVQKLGASSQSILSFDCLTKNGKLEYFTPSSAFMKVFFLAILPIALIILFLFVFGFLHLFLSKWFTDFKRNIAISTITILFLMHPTIVETTFGMFQCINIGEGIYKVRTDLNMSCYSFEHISWCLILGGPMILIWIVGCPSLALLFLIKNRKGLEEYKIQRYFIVLYQGLKNDKFYWEFINTLRKVGIVTINVFLSPYSQTYKGLTAIVWMIAFLRIQIFLDPYKLKINNHCEYLSYSASCVTLFGGILFVTDVTRVQLIDVCMFIFIIIINIYFILFWMHLMLLNFNKYSCARKLSNYILMILMKKGEGHKLSTISSDKKHLFILSSQNQSNFRIQKSKIKKNKKFKKVKEHKRLFDSSPRKPKDSSGRSKKETPKIPLNPLKKKEKFELKNIGLKNKRIVDFISKAYYEKQIIEEQKEESSNKTSDFYLYKMEIENLKGEQPPDSKMSILPINEEENLFRDMNTSSAQKKTLKNIFNPK